MLLSHVHFSRAAIIAIALSVASSFFIIKELDAKAILQPFYFLSAIAFVATIIHFFLAPKNVSHVLVRKMAPFMWMLAIFWTGIAINIISAVSQNILPSEIPFLTDVGRTAVLSVLSILIIYHLSADGAAVRFFVPVFLLPLVWAPLLLARYPDAISMLPPEWFSRIKLQGLQYNPTSFATWTMVSAWVSGIYALLFRKRWLLWALGSILSLALTWWTGSRAAIIATSILILGAALYFTVKKRKMSHGIIGIFILVASFFALAPYIQQDIIPRFSEHGGSTELQQQYAQDERLPLFRGQNREQLWIAYAFKILTCPFGSYGISFGASCDENFVENEHNSILQAGTWGGWISITGLGMLIIYAFRLIKKHMQAKDARFLACGGAFALIIVLASANNFLQLKMLWVLLAIVIGYSLFLEDSSKKRPSYFRAI